MERMFINSEIFTRFYDKYIKEGKLTEKDFQDCEKDLLNDPKKGELIPGMGGLRKTRIKSSTGGKRGGFRLDYIDFPEAGITYYVVIYPKNVKEDLSPEEKKVILKLVEKIKEGIKNG
jgi:RelE toxin of RelE / RelB toxin-antitoxin system